MLNIVIIKEEGSTKLIIERIDRYFAVCKEQFTGELINAAIDMLPKGVHSGIVFTLENGRILIDAPKDNTDDYEEDCRILQLRII
jgi:hypothetical protein